MKLRLASPALVALSFAAILPLHAAPRKASAAMDGKPAAANGAVTGWLHWRGPNQNGTTNETGLPDKVDAKQALWTSPGGGGSRKRHR